MSVVACGVRLQVALVVGSILTASFIPVTSAAAQVAAPNAAGHVLAEKFARDGDDAEKARLKKKAEAARKEQDRRKADEAEMLALARKEAADRQTEQERLRSQAEAEHLAAETKATEAARSAAEKKATENARIAAENKATEDARIAAEKKAADDALVAAMQESARRAAMEAERNREVERLAERLRQAREAQVAKSEPVRQIPTPHTAPSPSVAQTQIQDAPKTHASATTAASTSDRLTIVVWMQPGNRGIRRTNKSADPLLCSPAGCYVSNGPDEPASFRPGRKALGFAATFGARAGACSNHLGCVFRDVDVQEIGTLIQPVDMRIMHHDRRETFKADTLSDCTAGPGQLNCRRSIVGPDYVIWVVPEHLAARAGSDALERLANSPAADSEQAALPPIPARHH